MATPRKKAPVAAPTETEDQLKAKLRNQAERTVLAKHRDEYNAEAERLFKEHGLRFSRRLTDEEKAERQIAKLLAQHPNLRDQFYQPTAGQMLVDGGIKIPEGAAPVAAVRNDPAPSGLDVEPETLPDTGAEWPYEEAEPAPEEDREPEPGHANPSDLPEVDPWGLNS